MALVAELTGRSATFRLDAAFHVAPLTAPMAGYYPLLLAGIRIVAALALAATAWRLLVAHGTASAGEVLLRVVGQRRLGAPQLRLRLTWRRWLITFGATSLWYLVQNDAERVSEGRWPLFGPWLHTYALPVFAVLSVLFAAAWSLVSDWLAEVERYAAATYARAFRALRLGATPLHEPRRSSDDWAPRRLFGVVFESRPPPVPA